jgi:hypothetical protein
MHRRGFQQPTQNAQKPQKAAEKQPVGTLGGTRPFERGTASGYQFLRPERIDTSSAAAGELRLGG